MTDITWFGLWQKLDKKKKQQHDWLYRSSVRQNRNWTVGTYLTWCNMLWKTKQNNDLTDHQGAFYAKNDTELSWLIKLCANCDENQMG